MSAEWYKEQPKNRNFLNPIGYLLKLEKYEGTDFFCQTANIPDISMPVTEIGSQFRNLPIIPGGGVEFGDFSVRFIVDEDLNPKLIDFGFSTCHEAEKKVKIFCGTPSYMAP